MPRFFAWLLLLILPLAACAQAPAGPPKAGTDYELLCMQATILTVAWPAVIPFGLLLAFFRWLSARLEGDDE